MTDYKKTYTSFSGADILVSIDNQVFGELQGVSFSVTREKAPLYTLGSADPRAFSRGKRGISGSLIFLVFNRSPLPGGIPESTEERRKFISRPGEAAIYRGGDFEASQDVSITDDPGAQGWEEQPAWYADQLPPFDILVKAVNEYGHAAQMEIIGIEILNTGSGMSVDDITIDESHTYVARRIKKWYRQLDYSFVSNVWDASQFIGVAY